MKGYNFLYNKLIDKTDFDQYISGITYSAVAPPSDLQYNYDAIAKAVRVVKTTTAPRAGFKVIYTALKKGDVIEINGDVFNTGTTRFTTEIFEVGRIRTPLSTEKSSDWESIAIRYLVRFDGNVELFFGFLENEVGDFTVRNLSIKVNTITKQPRIQENIKRYVICKQPSGTFELRTSDFANDAGTLTFPDNTTMLLTFGTAFKNKRPMVIVSESGYAQSINYRAKAYDVQKATISIKLFNASNVAVDITQIPTGEYIFINVLAVDEITNL
jgi:hypothetical protein